MFNSLDQKVKKLYDATSDREAESHTIDEDIFHYIKIRVGESKLNA